MQHVAVPSCVVLVHVSFLSFFFKQRRTRYILDVFFFTPQDGPFLAECLFEISSLDNIAPGATEYLGSTAELFSFFGGEAIEA